MPAGEAIGVITLTDAVASVLEGLTHLIIFTDSDAAASALNTGSSHSPQIDYLVRWLVARLPGTQLLAIHIPGVSNRTSDALSRDKWEELVAGVVASGIVAHRMRPAGECSSMVEHAVNLPQRGSPA